MPSQLVEQAGELAAALGHVGQGRPGGILDRRERDPQHGLVGLGPDHRLAANLDRRLGVYFCHSSSSPEKFVAVSAFATSAGVSRTGREATMRMIVNWSAWRSETTWKPATG